MPIIQPHSLVKVGMVLIAAVNDNSWGSEGYRGLRQIAELGLGQVFYINRVPPAQWEAAFEKLALQGCQLILGHGGELSEVVRYTAVKHPGIMFACINGQYIGENLASLEIKDEQGSFLAGALAAKLSKTKVVGFVGGQQIPATNRHAVSFLAGAKKSGASAEARYCDSFSDPGQAREVAMGLIAENADVFYYYLNEGYRGLIQACNDFHCRVVCSVVDRIDEVRGGSAGCVHENVGELHVMAAGLFTSGGLRGIRYRVGLENPGVEKFVLHTTDTRLSQEMDELQNQLVAGNLPIL